MPKVSKIQPGFTTGEVSHQVYGRVDNPRYEMGMEYLQNYLPINQGPIIRRPGTKYAAQVKDSSKPPNLIPFSFSQTQNYMLEFGDKYIRFFQNEGQVITSSTNFLVQGFYTGAAFPFQGVRANPNPNTQEILSHITTINAGTILEVPTPYLFTDTANIKFVQKQDTLYMTHPSYQPMKLVRTGVNDFDLKPLYFQDGPYLPLNSYSTIADAANIGLAINISLGVPLPGIQTVNLTAQTTPQFKIINASSAGANLIQVFTSITPTYQIGDRVFIAGVVGTTELNNVTGIENGSNSVITQSSANLASWPIVAISGSSFTVQGVSLTHSYVGSGIVRPALFQLITGSSGQSWADIMVGSTALPGRNISYVTGGSRFWGTITDVVNASFATFSTGPGQPGVNPSLIIPALVTCSSVIWSLGTYSRLLGFPAACCFHQDRLVFAGSPAYPQEMDASVTSIYENFAASGSTFQVADNNALQFSLNSQDLNNILWMKSNSQGLLAGTQSGEWAVTPSTQNAALSPTNISANQVTAFGCYNADAILSGNAAIYIQRAARKVRELLYYWQVGNFRSTNLSEIAQHITNPSIIKLVNQKEPHSTIWGMRTDGALLSLTYNRDDVTLQANAGWARHYLGGQSDATGTQPLVTSMGVIPSGDGTYDELWLVTRRYINGSSVGVVEYMSRNFDDYQPQEQSYHFDCGVTYNSSIVVTGISNAVRAMVSSPNHGLQNSSVVRFYNTVGLNNVSTNSNGVLMSSNVVNEITFVVASAAVNSFFIQDFQGNFINTASSSIWVGSSVVNQLITQIAGLNFLAGETVSILADGGIHVNTSVTQAGLLTLAYPAAVVQIGYQYNSDAQMLRTHEGSAQGTSIGSNRRCNRVAFMLHNVGDFQYGPSFQRLVPAEFIHADVDQAGEAPSLFDGIYRDGIESGDDQFTDDICFRQNSGLPGMIQAITRFLEENDV